MLSHDVGTDANRVGLNLCGALGALIDRRGHVRERGGAQTVTLASVRGANRFLWHFCSVCVCVCGKRFCYLAVSRGVLLNRRKIFRVDFEQPASWLLRPVRDGG